MSGELPIHRLGELVMDRLLDVEERVETMCDPSVSTSGPGDLTVDAELLIDGEWQHWWKTFTAIEWDALPAEMELLADDLVAYLERDVFTS